MATIVMITGTNATGKTTLAKALIRRFGGIEQTLKDRTLVKDKRTVFLGRYAESIKYGGVDMLNETKCLEAIAQELLSQGVEYIFAEGVYLKTFGLNLQRFLFCAKKQYVVYLYAPLSELQNRLQSRSNKKLNASIVQDGKTAMSSAKKWAEVGVPVISFDTSIMSPEGIADEIINKLQIEI